MITYLHETGQLQKAYYTQTAPYHQGSRYVFQNLIACYTLNFVNKVDSSRIRDFANTIRDDLRHDGWFFVPAP